MSLTNRGKGVAVIAIGGFLLALLFGSRSLNAVVVPAVVLLAAAYVQVTRLPDLAIVREPPADAHVGEVRTAEIAFTDRDGEELRRPFIGTVSEYVGDGLRIVPPGDEGEDVSEYTVRENLDGSTEAQFQTAVGNESLSYRVRYEQRGERELGPATVTATDVFGLMETGIHIRETGSVLVYPQVHFLRSWSRESLRRLREYGRSEQRDQFEELREYHPGDPLRDIHWRTTAKRDKLVVKEFAAEAEAEAVTIAAGANVDGADRMAEATASVALTLVDEDIPVDVALPRGEVSVGPERGGELALLRTLATAKAGRLPDPEADVRIHGRGEEATIEVGETEYRFTELLERDSDAVPTVTRGTVEVNA
ncbi:MAG: DUF58 domain-containing protein [Halolamina sp.]|uniref:DUF58 domain-containing protein n=1 Tax=Halolamina sp. TaxID=1940283 RepID=UPI002FC3DA9D